MKKATASPTETGRAITLAQPSVLMGGGGPPPENSVPELCGDRMRVGVKKAAGTAEETGNSARAPDPFDRGGQEPKKMRFVPVWIANRVEFVCAVVDDEDLPKLKGRWYLSRCRAYWSHYLRYDRSLHYDVNVIEPMHRVVLGLEPGNPFEGDHRNGNHLGNRKKICGA